MKSLAKNIVVMILSRQVRRLYKKHSIKTVVVAGSIGKTSTKFAVATVLSQKYRVRFQEGNYNDVVSVPLIFFGLEIPSLLNPLAWLKTFGQINRQIKSDYPYDIVVLELGIDGPGQMAKFKSFIQADVGLLTAIAPEHMEYFVDLDAVAAEELVVAQLCKQLVVNKDLCDPKYLSQLATSPTTYSVRQTADYQLADLKYNTDGYGFSVLKKGQQFLQTSHEAISESQLYSLCSAVSLGDIFEIPVADIERGLHDIHAVSGRMQRLRGINNSIIIDDTYNASPEAVKGALDTLYKIQAPQKIAILGNMNELGQYSQAAHVEVGEYCDPKQLNLVITIGEDANKYLSEAAAQKGCQVKTFTSPYEAGEYLKTIVQNGAVILAKGSQNGVFAEETVKLLLLDQADQSKLVRQSAYWLKVKQKQFGKPA